jgi:hypothetical protein
MSVLRHRDAKTQLHDMAGLWGYNPRGERAGFLQVKAPGWCPGPWRFEKGSALGLAEAPEGIYHSVAHL